MKAVLLDGSAANGNTGERVRAALTAQDMMARAIMPPWAYRLTGDLGWIRAARGYGVLTSLRRQPYRAETKWQRVQ